MKRRVYRGRNRYLYEVMKEAMLACFSAKIIRKHPRTFARALGG